VSSDEDGKDQQTSHNKENSSGTTFSHLAGSTLDAASCSVPVSYAGFLLKSRKSPMKGWHKVTCLSM